MVLKPWQKGALGLAGLLGFLGLLSIKTRAEEPCEEGSIEYIVCRDPYTGETETVIQSPRMMPPLNSFALRECRNGVWVELHPDMPLSWCWAPASSHL